MRLASDAESRADGIEGSAHLASPSVVKARAGKAGGKGSEPCPSGRFPPAPPSADPRCRKQAAPRSAQAQPL
ncbi:hypothetical protein GUJ93_ZPchr0001g29339 [Zizania palustris]|uniref:Uncharacterized protein n=1 Tax=Zizania palustris TaxID=103762 RepID=A0A8J5VNJ5_ZIZPA|nr:hypothetical protein GUJ93_ZPchr0001g29339 [Zizania palustris]